MSLSSVNNVKDSMARLNVLFSDMNAELQRVKNYYDGMIQEAQHSFVDSQQHWINKAQQEQSRLSSMSGERLAQVDEMVNGLESLERQLCMVDKSYAKRRENEYALRTDVPSVNYDENNYFEKLKEIHDEAIAIARECSLTVKAQPIQEIGMLFSSKRKEKYERLYFLLQETQKLRKIALKKIDESITNQKGNWDEKRETEINKAADETAELIQAINDRREEEIHKITSRINAELDSLLSARDVEILDELRMCLGDNNILPDECSEHIMIGEMGIDLSNIMSISEALQFVNSHYAGHFRGTEFVLPAIYDMRENCNFCFDGRGNTDSSKDAIKSVMYSMLKNQPASRQMFYLSDPEGRSRGFDIYLDFLKLYPDVFGGKILTTRDIIRDCVRNLSSYVDEIGQTKLVGYRDIFEYNQDVPDKQEGLKCLCLLNFPKYFDEEMLDALYNIVRNGKSYGVQVLIDFDERSIPERIGENQLSLISKIMTECLTLESMFGKWRFSNGVTLSLEKCPSIIQLRNFCNEFTKQYKEVKNTSLPLIKIVPKDSWFEGDSSGRLAIPIGKNEDGVVQNLVFGEGTSHHAMVIGSLGSGKSTLLHTIIMSTITSFSPDEVNLYLMDFKSGTEFKVYAEKNIPHIKLLALDAMQEFGQSILDNLWAEMNARSELFNSLIKEGLNVKDINDYRKLTGKKMPRILVVADEFQMLFSEEHNRKIANYCGGKLADFISLSRVYGIHFILATQTMSRLMSGFSIRKSTINEMYVRIGLKCTESECNSLFGDRNGRAAFAKMGTEKGSAVYTEDYVQGSPIGFKVAYCNPEMQESILSEIEDRYSLMECRERTKVFVGDSVPSIMDCTEFIENSQDIKKVQPIYLGEPIRIASSVRINLNRMKRSNLLIVGTNQEMMDQLVALYMLNVVENARRAGRNGTTQAIYLFDGMLILGEEQSRNIKQVLSAYAWNIKAARDNFEIVDYIDELYSIYENRREHRLSGNTNDNDVIAVVINNVQWIEVIRLMLQNKKIDEFVGKPKLKKENKSTLFGEVTANTLSMMDDFLADMKESNDKHSTTNISYSKKLLTLLEQGYTYGINFVMSSPDYISIKEHMYDVVPKFSNRIVFAISNSDADRIISEAKPEQIKNNIVIYHDGINPSHQFKPYSGIAEYINKFKGGL